MRVHYSSVIIILPLSLMIVTVAPVGSRWFSTFPLFEVGFCGRALGRVVFVDWEIFTVVDTASKIIGREDVFWKMLSAGSTHQGSGTDYMYPGCGCQTSMNDIGHCCSTPSLHRSWHMSCSHCLVHWSWGHYRHTRPQSTHNMYLHRCGETSL